MTPRDLADHLRDMMDSLDDSVTREQIYEQLRLAWVAAEKLAAASPSEETDKVVEIDPSAYSHNPDPVKNNYSRKHFPDQDVVIVAARYGFYLITACGRQLPPSQINITLPPCPECEAAS